VEPITEARLRTLLVELHRQISLTADACVGQLGDGATSGDLTYPPDAALNEAEVSALSALRLDAAARSGLTKLVVEAAGTAAFNFFAVVDAVGDPAVGGGELWLGARFAEPDGSDGPMIHEAFFETYSDLGD
jgi:hypothetical protein